MHLSWQSLSAMSGWMDGWTKERKHQYITQWAGWAAEAVCQWFGRTAGGSGGQQLPGDVRRSSPMSVEADINADDKCWRRCIIAAGRRQLHIGMRRTSSPVNVGARSVCLAVCPVPFCWCLLGVVRAIAEQSQFAGVAVAADYEWLTGTRLIDWLIDRPIGLSPRRPSWWLRPDESGAVLIPRQRRLTLGQYARRPPRPRPRRRPRRLRQRHDVSPSQPRRPASRNKYSAN